MADEKLSELPVISLPLQSTDQIYVVRSGVSYQATVDDVPGGDAVWGGITGTIGDQGDLQAEFDQKADVGLIDMSGLTMSTGFILGRFSSGVGPVELIVTQGTGEVVLDTGATLNSPILITPDLGTPAAVVLTNATAVPAGQIVGVIPIANLATGTPSGAKFIRDDGTLAVPIGSGGTVTSVTSANSDATVATQTTTPVITIVSAPKLTTARNINGVAFDGTANITVTAAAGTLTGTTLASGVVTSSLTTVGALASGSLATGFVVGGVTMTLGSDASFDLYYRNGSGVLTRLGMGTTGQYLAANTGAAPTWGTPAGAGTVTHTGNLTSNAVVLGNGTADTKVVAGITTDGTSILNLGVTSTTAGKVKLFGGTSGDATIQTAAAAGTATVVTLPNASSTLPIFGQQLTFSGPTAARTVTLPDASFTVARTDAANTFTGVQTMTSPAFLTSATLDGVKLYPGIPPNAQTGDYTLAVADANTAITNAGGGTHDWTIPANGSIPIPVGSTVVFINPVNVQRNIKITTDTLIWLPSGATGNRIMASYGMATVYKADTTTWYITGVGLT